MKQRELLTQPLLGMQTTVAQSNHAGLVGITGVVVAETAHTLTVQTNHAGVCKVVPKNTVTLSFDEHGEHIVSGKALQGTLHRIKKYA